MSDQASPLDPAQAAASRPKRQRPRFTYDIPKDVRTFEADPSTITLTPVTVEEEKMAIQAARANNTQVDHELLKLSLVEADGRPLDWAGGVRDDVFEGASPKVRQLMIEAWQDVNTPTREQTKSFLASRRAKL